MSVDLKTLTPDTTLPQDGVLFGADSQSAANPSVYPVANVKDALNSGIGSLSGDVNTLWDLSSTPVASLTLTKNTTLYSSNFKAGGTYKLIVFQDATGGWTLGYNGNFKWPNDTVPTVTSTAYAMTVIEFVSNGTYLYGSVAQPFDGSPSPTVLGNFANPTFDYSTLSTLASMPTGGSISRSGNAMLYDSNGYLTYAPNNLFTYNADFSNAAWSVYYATKVGAYAGTDPAGTNTAYEFKIDSSGGGGTSTCVYNSFTSVTGVRYLASFWVKAKSGTTSVRVRFFDGSANSYSSDISVSDTGWTRVSYAYTSTASSASAFAAINTNAAATTTNVYVAFAQLEAITYQTTPSGTYYVNYPTPTTSAAYYGPRFDYDPATLAAKGLLIEGARTNYCTSSCIYNGYGWATAGLTINSTNNAAPDGTNTASNLTLSTSGYMYGSNINVTNGTYNISVSVWLSGAAGTKVAFRVIDAAAGTSGGTQILTLTTTPTRYTFSTVVVVTGGSGISYGIENRAGVVAGLPGIAATFTMWGMQAEQGAFPTSYIYTPNAAGTPARAAETFSITGYSSNLIEAYYTDEATGISSSLNYAAGVAPSTSYGWTTSLRVYTNAYAGDIATPAWIDNSGTVGGRMVTDSTGLLTWAPENLLLNSASSDLWSGSPKAQTVAVTSAPVTTGGEIGAVYVLSFYGTGSVAITGTSLVFYTGASTLAGTGASNRVSACFFAAQGNLTFTVTGTVTSAQLERVTYQTSPRAYIPTTDSAKFLPRYDFDSRTYFGFSANITNGSTTSTFVVPTPLSDGSLPSATDSYYVGQNALINGVSYPVTAYVGSTITITGLPASGSQNILLGNPSWLTPRGMLIEEQRSNLLTYSNTFTGTGWTNNANVTVGATSATNSPDGTQNAVIATATAGVSAASVTHSVTTVTASTAYTYSIYVKGNVGTTINLNISDWVTGQLSATINPFTGVCSVAAGVYSSASVVSENVGNGWWRYKITATQPTGQTGLAVRVQFPNNADSCYLFGAQLEQATFATSYMGNTTTGSPPITRVPDVVKLSGSALTTLQGTTASVLVEANNIQANYGSVIGIAAGTLIQKSATSLTQLYMYTTDNNVYLQNLPANTLAGTFRTGIAYNALSSSLAANNQAIVTSNYPPYPRTNVSIGSNGGSAPYACGWFRSLSIYNQRLPDAILKQKSTVGAPY